MGNLLLQFELDSTLYFHEEKDQSSFYHQNKQIVEHHLNIETMNISNFFEVNKNESKIFFTPEVNDFEHPLPIKIILTTIMFLTTIILTTIREYPKQ